MKRIRDDMYGPPNLLAENISKVRKMAPLGITYFSIIPNELYLIIKSKLNTFFENIMEDSIHEVIYNFISDHNMYKYGLNFFLYCSDKCINKKWKLKYVGLYGDKEIYDYIIKNTQIEIINSKKLKCLKYAIFNNKFDFIKSLVNIEVKFSHISTILYESDNVEIFKYYYKNIKVPKYLIDSFYYGSPNISEYLLTKCNNFIESFNIREILHNYDINMDAMYINDMNCPGLNNICRDINIINEVNTESYIINKIDSFMNFLINKGYINGSICIKYDLHKLFLCNNYILYKIITKLDIYNTSVNVSDEHGDMHNLFKEKIVGILKGESLYLNKQTAILLNYLISGKYIDMDTIGIIIQKIYSKSLYSYSFINYKNRGSMIFLKIIKSYLQLDVFDINNYIINNNNLRDYSYNYKFINNFLSFGIKITENTYSHLNKKDKIPYWFTLNIIKQLTFDIMKVSFTFEDYIKYYNTDNGTFCLLIRNRLNNDDYFEKLFLYTNIYDKRDNPKKLALNWYYNNKYNKDKKKFKIKMGISMVIDILKNGVSIPMVGNITDEYFELYNLLSHTINEKASGNFKMPKIHKTLKFDMVEVILPQFPMSVIYIKNVDIDNILNDYGIKNIIYE
jgi:hypothetical protein